MATLPSASVTISAEAGALAGGTGYCVVIAAVATNADTTPRVFSSAKSLIAQHGYAQGVDYAAIHLEETKQPVLFVGIPIATAGDVVREDKSGVTGTSVVSVAAGGSGILEETDAIITVTTGGTIGANGIVFTLSLDGGITEKTIRLGTANSYTVPYVGLVISFAAGTLVAGDVYRFATTAPMWDSAGISGARQALAEQQKTTRSWMAIGDIPNATFAGYITTAVNAYASSNDRFTYARVNVRDRTVSMTGTPTLTFAEVGGTGDTITRSAGSFVSDGFVPGMVVTVKNSTSNNVTGAITAVSATVLTLDTTDLVPEVATPGASISGELTMAAWVSGIDAEFASVDAQKRIDIGLGRLRRLSPITGWEFRRPVSWAASVREYTKDVHVPVWRKKDGPLLGWSMLDADGNIAEFDERTDGGGLAGRFTCARSWANGPNGAFIAMSLTRDTEGSLLSFTHNMAVANIGCSVVQSATENVVGQVLQLNDDGTAKSTSLGKIQEAVNTDVKIALMQEHVPGEGPRASKAVWTASTTDDLSVVDATMTGVLELIVNGTVVHVNTVVRVS